MSDRKKRGRKQRGRKNFEVGKIKRARKWRTKSKKDEWIDGWKRRGEKEKQTQK